MKRLSFQIGLLTLLIVLVSGCLYPDEQRKAAHISPAESIVVVQNAVDRYYEDHGVLPIKNFNEHTPYYQRYTLDFEKLLRTRYLSSIPPAAFENGGNYYFVLVHVDTHPQVKLFDLRAVQQVGNVENDVARYKETNGRLPLGEPYTGGWHRLDYAAIGLDSSPVQSMFSGIYTGLIIHETGIVAIDYVPDIMTVIQREEKSEFAENFDLRQLLVDHSYYVPVRSYPYYWREDRPVIAEP